MSTIPFPEMPATTQSTVVEIVVPGLPGPPGPPGPGIGLVVKGVLPGVASLPVNPTISDAWVIGTSVYVWNGTSWTVVTGLVGPQGVPGPAGAVPIPTWADATSPSLLAAGWTTYQAKPYFSLDALTRVSWRGSLQWTGPAQLSDGTLIMTVPSTGPGSLAPSTNRTLFLPELSNPPRSYRVDIAIDGTVRLRYPAGGSTGQISLDSMFWVI